jgi:hypothetical protein
MTVGIIGQLDWQLDGINSGGSLVANKPGNRCREFLHTELSNILSYREDAQGLHC